MTKFNQDIIDQMISFGFKQHYYYSDNGTTIYEYKYKPAYLNGNHYHLIIYDYHMKSLSTNYQLYIYDPDHRSVQIVYQFHTMTEYRRNALTDCINNIFNAEIRIVNINNIINE